MDSLTKLEEGDSHGSAHDACAENSPLAQPLTRNEALVHASLKAAARPMKAYELLDLLHDAGLKAPMTIYRALDGLQAKGYAQKVISRNAFVSIDESARSHFRAVITCRHCGAVQLLPLAESNVRMMLQAGEAPITKLFIEAVGECHGADCPDR